MVGNEPSSELNVLFLFSDEKGLSAEETFGRVERSADERSSARDGQMWYMVEAGLS